MDYSPGFVIFIVSVGVPALVLLLLYAKSFTYKDNKESRFEHLIGQWKIRREKNSRRKEYSYLMDHYKWLKDRVQEDDGKEPENLPTLISHFKDAKSNKSLKKDLDTLFRDKMHLFQKLNYHRVVEEMNRQINYVLVILVVVAIACLVLPFFYYSAGTLEPEANTEYAEFIHKIDSVHNIAGFIITPSDSNSDVQARHKDTLFAQLPNDPNQVEEYRLFRQKAMDAKFQAMADFSSGYTSFLFIKQALIRFVTIAFLFTILGYLLRMYRRLLDKRTRFRQLEEATTITLFYLFKKVARAKTDEERKEAKLIEQSLPKMIDKLYDFSVIEPAKGGKDDERINSTISEMNKAIHDVYKMIADIKQSTHSQQ